MLRRHFLRRLGLAALALPAGGRAASRRAAGLPRPEPLLKPPRLKPGDTVGLVSPGGVLSEPSDVAHVREVLAELGLRTKLGRHALDQRGYLAGTDAARAGDLHRMFADPDVDALLALRGGWGSARILPLLDYELIRAYPKILVGFSDITALLLAVYARSGLVTFHGPVGISTWNPFTVDYFRRLLFEGEALRMENPEPAFPLRFNWNRIQTIAPGTARGVLAGGNLSVLTALLGSPYLPDWDGHVLFLEDTNEGIYRIDRMLTQLALAGVLPKLSGLVFGKCTDCEPDSEGGSLTLEEVFADHLQPLGIPAWYGAMIGHIGDKFTLPLGVPAEIDAAAGTIQLLEPAVQDR